MEQVQTEGFPRTYSHPRGGADFGGGLVTFPNLFAIPWNATPNCLDVKFSIGGGVEKRLGSTTLNSVVLVTTAATGFSPDSGNSLATSISSFWNLNEQAGIRLDAIGVNTLTDANSSVGFAAGKVSNAATFVMANSSSLEVADVANLRGGERNFSLGTWFYMDSLNSTSTATSLISKGDGGNVEYDLRVSELNQVLFALGDTGGNENLVTATSFGAVTTATWYHVVAFYDSTNARIGVSVNLSVNTASFTARARTSTVSFKLGSRRAPGSPSADQEFFGGRLDDAGFWTKVLTVQERSDLFNSGNGNEYNSNFSTSGYGMFDFGAGFGADGLPLRWLVVAAGTGVYASSNRGVTFVVIATDRGADYQFFERSKSLLIATSNTQNKVLYWAGSVGTFMAALPVGSAPSTKHALDFGGFLLLMNDSANKRRVTYADNTKILSDPFTTTFELPGPLDDEITGAITYNRSAYGFTRYTVSRISQVGGNPDFAVQPVKVWGAVPGTIKRVTFKEEGEVIISLGWDRHVRIFDGTEDRIISTPIEEPNALSSVYLNGIETTALHRCRAEVDTEEQVYRLLVVMSPSAQTTHAVCLNLRTGAWYPYRNTPAFNAMVMAESGNSRILTGVTRGGFVHWINTTNSDAGIAIDEYYESPLLYSQTPRTLSKSQKMVLYFSATSSGQLYYQERVNFGTTFEAPRDRIVLGDSTSVTQIRKVIDIPVMQNVYQYRLSSSANTNPPWRLNRFDFEGRDLGVGAA